MVWILGIPVVTALICSLLKSARLIGYVSLAGTAALAAAALPVIVSGMASPVETMSGVLYNDSACLFGYRTRRYRPRFCRHGNKSVH